MASHASVPSRGLPPKPPDKGSFPLDHFGECSDAKAVYMRCLRDHNMHAQNDECRKLSAEYLKCRMDSQLMAREEIHKLGFSNLDGGAQKDASAPMAHDGPSQNQQRRERGFLAGARAPKPQSGNA